MKKRFALIPAFALTVALLTSCELMVPGPTERPSIGLPGEPAGTGRPAPTEGTDPTVDEYGFTIFPEGNYLADPKFDTDEFLPDYDADPAFVHYLSTQGSTLCQTEDTIYSLYDTYTPNKTRDILMFTDKATGISLPLCGRPECLHNSSTCNAYMTDASGLRVYEGKLYWVDGELNGSWDLMSMNLDGTGRSTVTSMRWARDTLHTTQSTHYVIHRGYAYVSGTTHEVIVNGERMSSVSICAQPLDGGEGFTVWNKLIDGLGAMCAVKPVGNDLYIMLHYFDYVDRENVEGQFDTVEFYRWSSKTREAEFLYSETVSPESELWFYYHSIHPVPGDGIYFEGYRLLDGVIYPNHDNCILKYSFETGTIEEGAWLEGYEWLYYTPDYVFTERDAAVYVFDYGGNLVSRHEPVEGHTYIRFVGADSRYSYWVCSGRYDDDHIGHYIAVPIRDGGVIITE